MVQSGLFFHSLQAFPDHPAVSGDPGQGGQSCGLRGVVTGGRSQVLTCRQRSRMTAFRAPLGELCLHELRYVRTCSRASALVCARSPGHWPGPPSAAGALSLSPAPTRCSAGSKRLGWTIPSKPRCVGWPAWTCSSLTTSLCRTSTRLRPPTVTNESSDGITSITQRVLIDHARRTDDRHQPIYVVSRPRQPSGLSHWQATHMIVVQLRCRSSLPLTSGRRINSWRELRSLLTLGFGGV